MSYDVLKHEANMLFKK